MSAALTAGGGLLQGVSQFEAGQTRREIYSADQDIALRQSQSEAQAGAANENAVRLRGKAIEGQQIANTGANNLQQAGTPAQVVAGTAGTNELDALTTRNNALRRAWGFQVQGASDALQSDLVSKSGKFNAEGSILSGASKAYTESNAAGSWF